MRTPPAAPAGPAPEPVSASEQAASDITDLRVPEQTSLDDAAPIVDAEHPPADETPAAERRPTRHDEQMAAIVARRREQIEAERAEGRAQGMADQEPLVAPGAPAQPVEAQQPALASPQADPASASPAPAAEPAAPIRTHKILVRGNEIVMSDDDMRRAAELGIESEARIRHANAVLEEARRLAAASGQPIPGAGPSPPAAAPQPPAQAPLDRRDVLRELAREMLYGDEEKVVDALDRAWPTPQTQSADPDAMAREVYSRIDARLGLQNALQTFGSEYAEIVNDPDLATLAANRVQQLRAHYAQTGTPRSELDLFREAGQSTREFVQRLNGGGPTPQPQPAAPAPQQNAGGPSRVAIKRSMPQAPAAAAAQQATPAPRQKTGSDIVNDMRRARGQPVFV